MMVQNGVHKRSWLGYKSHPEIRYCSEYIMFQVYLDLSYHGGTMMALMLYLQRLVCV